MPRKSDALRIAAVVAALEAAYGGQTWHWAPEHVRGPFDVIAGAILVQHTTWVNAERALEQLRVAGALDVSALLSRPDDELLGLIRVSGTPTVKLHRLRAIAQTIADAGGLDALLALPPADLRARLLATHGVGMETADGIALYAAGHPVFVVDAYSTRLLTRLGLTPAEGRSYEAWQRYIEDALPAADAVTFQRLHAHIVLHGKALCRTRPRCASCPLLQVCPTGAVRVAEDVVT